MVFVEEGADLRIAHIFSPDLHTVKFHDGISRRCDGDGIFMCRRTGDVPRVGHVKGIVAVAVP